MQDKYMNGILFYRLDIKDRIAHVGYVKDAELFSRDEVRTPLIIELFPKKGHMLHDRQIGFKFFYKISDDNYGCIKELFEQKLW